MRTKHAGLAGLAVSLAFAVACITVNIYFPEATVKQTAEEIVDEVRPKETKEIEVPTAASEDKAHFRKGGFSLVPSAYAQEETTVSTPTIRALKQSLKERFAGLKPYYDGGHIGETNKGLVEVRGESGLDLKRKAELRSLVKDENGDRRKLYAEVAKALNIDADQIGRIQKIFAETWISRASPGWWIQKEDGTWAKKT
jgi:uncharacterized protein YdbL (DUF1318 family)